ncbi:hypothetical protein SAMN05216376_12914 [Mameliella alba]|uniref:hypothetical protein n=1 Tax=Mameliella alba TaxID=561184 RepID=UPI00088219E5|nr:hypothetical protein [Mameliella alba]OWV40361.1 hypothetical protein CDZ96_25995 [Mameliella alba]PTR33189.1 hypothetical protein LX94_05136 [Mameliella alba]GGF86218.1 hypothetical protein GCM10011319_52460 [Mameliella alba]SDE34758.1 hypothetical protein SAMN05216376_12914 [Mameliella alba]
MLEMPDGNIVLPRPPQNARKVAKGRRNHFTGQTNIGTDEEGGMDIESYTELQVLLALLARPGTKHVENQVKFEFTGPDGETKDHFFDFRVTKFDGSRTALMVKAAYRFRQAKIRDELVYIASRVPTSFADKVEVVTEKNLVSSEIYNAEMMHQMRRPVPDADAAARRAIRDIRGDVQIRDLVEIIGHAGAGFQALVRLIRTHELTLTRQERISYDTYVTRSHHDA